VPILFQAVARVLHLGQEATVEHPTHVMVTKAVLILLQAVARVLPLGQEATVEHPTHVMATKAVHILFQAVVKGEVASAMVSDLCVQDSLR
jgi:hypothetical protein